MLAYALLWLKLNTKYRLAFVYWLLPNYQQDLFNGNEFSDFCFQLTSAAYSLSNFSLSFNIFLLLLSCCKSLDFYKFQFQLYTTHTNFPLTPISGPQNCGPWCCSTPSTPPP